MLEILRKFFRFCDERERSEFYRSIVLGVLAALFSALKIPAIGVMLQAILVEGVTAKTILLSLAVMLISVIGSSILKYRATALQTDGGYSTTANKRVQIAEHLRYLPMGYFNDQSLGELTGITTTVLDEVESTGPMVLVGILGGLINSAVMLLCVLFWDWRIGLLALAGMLVYLVLLSGMEKQSAKIAPKRQRDEARLVEAVLEQLQGMSVIKSFNLTGKGDRRVRQALEDSRANNLAVEKLFTPYIWGQEMVLHLFSVLILAASVGLCLTGAMSLANALMAVIVSFLIFSQIQSAGSGVSALRLVGSSIDHANQVDGIPEMDQRGTDIRPEGHGIVFDHVNFSYGSRPILKDVSLTIPDRTTTAIVGPSGSGKTTLCNLIARFWDVDGGRVTIGGRDVREYTLESLMEQVSMVFQRVYLFADTVENNRYSRKYYSYYSSKYNFVLLFPSRWQGVVSAVLNTQDNEIVFISYDPEKKFTVDKTTELMRIRTIAKDDTEALVNSKDYRMIGESDESIICIKETTGYLTGKLALTESELQNSLIVL